MNEETTKCAWCGKKFTPCRKHQKCCSKRCQELAYYRKNKDRILAKERASYRQRKQTQSYTKVKIIFQMPDPYTDQALYFDGLHGMGRNLICRRPDFGWGF